MALQALAAFASLTTAKSGDNSELSLSAVFGDRTHDFLPVSRENALVLQTVEVIKFKPSKFSYVVYVLLLSFLFFTLSPISLISFSLSFYML